ncbi:MAG: PorT family protein [Flavobacteriales bacterium]|nr:PorT family protein [Flavobacteriales bacterium]
MKNSLLSLFLIGALAVNLFAQTEEEKDFAKLDSMMKVIERQDTSSIKLGNLDILFIEDKDCEQACYDHVCDWSCDFNCNWDCNDDFEIHWSGIDIGANGLLTPGNETTAPDGFEFLELNYGKSFSIGLNMLEKNIPLYQNHITLVTGLGVEFNHYAFKNNTSLQSNNDSIWAYEETVVNFQKNKLKTTFLKVPLMLGFSTSEYSRKSFHLAAGVVLGYKLGSKLKQKYEFEGDKYTPKVKGDYNIQPFRYSATVRMGYGNFSLFADYALSRMFEKNRGPELYPFSIGFTLMDI